jgi:PTS hybrid protein
VRVVGIVVVSHSSELAQGLAELAAQMAGPDVRIEPAGGLPDGGLGTDEDRVRAAIRAADQGEGVVVLGDLGSAILTVRHVLQRHNGNGSVRLVDAPIVEGAVAAAVTASANMKLDDVARSAEEARGAGKL